LLEHFVRPVLTLTGVICHGFCTMMWLADETQSHGASAFLEVLLLAIDKVYNICKLKHIRFPDHLVVQSDNPTNQAKKQWACLFLAFLVCANIFLTTTLCFLMMGHTHEDIDADFGSVCEILLKSLGYDCPECLAMILKAGLKAKMLRRGEELYVERLGAVRDYKLWLSDLGVELFNAFATRDKLGGLRTTIHSIAFKRRQDLFPEEKHMLRQGLSHDFGAEQGDVFALCKVYMHSVKLSQPPLLVLPKSYLNKLKSRGPFALVANHGIDPDRAGAIQKRANFHRDPGNDLVDLYLPHTVAYYEALLANPHVPMPPAAEVLTEQRCLGSTLGGASTNAEFPHLPSVAWELKVRYAMRAR
jgi:hypothetical protein